MENPKRGLEELTQIESAANEIIRDRAEIVALDKRRHMNREGIRALINENKEKSWVAIGPVLIQLKTDKAKSLLEEDMKCTDTEINKLRSDLKVKVSKLQDLEHKDPIPGMNLKPLTRDELAAFRQVHGEHA